MERWFSVCLVFIKFFGGFKRLGGREGEGKEVGIRLNRMECRRVCGIYRVGIGIRGILIDRIFVFRC